MTALMPKDKQMYIHTICRTHNVYLYYHNYNVYCMYILYYHIMYIVCIF